MSSLENSTFPPLGGDKLAFGQRMRSQVNLECEEKLFKAVDKLRKNMDAAECNHVVLGLLFLKYISAVFEHCRTEVDAELRADFVIASPPVNDSDWSGQLLRADARWRFGVPPAGNANYAWNQHFLYYFILDGYAGFVIAHVSLTSQQSGEGDIRRRMVEEDLVDCIVALSGQLFYSTCIPVCLWFLAKNKDGKGFRNRKGGTLFINAGTLGYLEDRTHRMFEDKEISRITDTYHRWRGTLEGAYEDVLGFCKSTTCKEIAKSDFVLTPDWHCGSEAVEDDGEEFVVKFARLRKNLDEHFSTSAILQERIMKNLSFISQINKGRANE